MTRGKLNNFIFIGIILAITGSILLFFSVNMGTSLADEWLYEQGSADTAMYLMITESYIQNFLVAGGVLLGIGLAVTILCYYKILSTEELNEKTV